MTDYVKQCVDHYLNVSGDSALRVATTPFCPESMLPEEDDDTRGELGDAACSILMKNLWVARLARPEQSKAIGELATKVNKWSKMTTDV